MAFRTREGGQLGALVEAARPRQWIKNLLVVAAPAAAGRLLDPAVAARTALAFVAFTLTAAGTYLLNDVRDRKRDARHHRKRERAVASGRLSVGVAATAGAALLVLGPVLALVTGALALAAVVAGYAVLTVAYTTWLKRVPLLDLAVVTTGFLLRAVAGGAATGIDLSRWFLIVTSFAALYVVANKRYAELRADDGNRATRSSLRDYSDELLREIRFTAGAVAVTGYVLWAFENARGGGAVWFELSIAPFVLAMYRYAMAVDAGLGEAPEDIVLRDRLMQGLGATWAVLFGAGLLVS